MNEARSPWSKTSFTRYQQATQRRIRRAALEDLALADESPLASRYGPRVELALRVVDVPLFQAVEFVASLGQKLQAALRANRPVPLELLSELILDARNHFGRLQGLRASAEGWTRAALEQVLPRQRKGFQAELSLRLRLLGERAEALARLCETLVALAQVRPQ